MGLDLAQEPAHPAGPFDADEARCAEALAAFHGDLYVFPGRDGNGLWWALRRDGLPALSGRTPDELRAAIDGRGPPGLPRKHALNRPPARPDHARAESATTAAGRAAGGKDSLP
jgi:hypothetical protein